MQTMLNAIGYLISIHTPHAGSDFVDVTFSGFRHGFQSTLPMRGVTVIQCKEAFKTRISIHTPHAGSDVLKVQKLHQRIISIHTPHAGSDIFIIPSNLFSSISIHTPHAGSDLICRSPDHCSVKFQSTLPMRGVTCMLFQYVPTFEISIHTPHAGSDALCGEILDPDTISIHTPHAGSDFHCRRFTIMP